MWLAYLLSSLLVLLIVADLDKGTHIRIYVKAAPIEKPVKSPQSTTDHSHDNNSSFSHIPPQSSVYNVGSQSNATFEQINATFTHLIDEVLSIPINNTTEELISAKTTANISTDQPFTRISKFAAVLSAIVSDSAFVSSPPFENTSSNSFYVDPKETSPSNWTNAVWSTWLSDTDNDTDDNSSSSVTQNNSHSSALSWVSARSNSSYENSTADLTPAHSPTIQSTGTASSGFKDQLNGASFISVITVTPPPLPTVAPLPIPIPITDSAAASAAASATASVAPPGTLSDRSGLGSGFGSLAFSKDTSPPDFGTGTSSLTENEFDVELLQHQLNTALGIVLGFHQPTRNSDSNSSSAATVPPTLSSAPTSTSQTETESTDEDYSYENAILYRPLLDLSERVVALLLASEGRRSEVLHSEGAEVQSSELLESNTTTLHLEDSAEFTKRESAERIGRLVTPTAVSDEDATSTSEERLAPELQSSQNTKFGNDSAETIRMTWKLKQGDDSDDYFYSDSGENENNLTMSMMPF